MSYRFTCSICGREMEEDGKDGLVNRARHHLRNDHGMMDSSDTNEPNILEEGKRIREQIEGI